VPAGGGGAGRGSARADPARPCLPIPPEYGAAFATGFLQGRGAARTRRGPPREGETYGVHFRPVGYRASTAGPDGRRARRYTRGREKRETSQGRPDFE
jgi:hypothetical protein